MSEETPTYTASFKTGTGYDASLLVVRGNTANELESNILDLVNGEAFDVLVDAQYALQAVANVKAPDAPAPTSEMVSQQNEPAGVIRMCPHGKRTKRTGTNARGPWVGWFCPLPKNDANQCKPDWED